MFKHNFISWLYHLKINSNNISSGVKIVIKFCIKLVWLTVLCAIINSFLFKYVYAEDRLELYDLTLQDFVEWSSTKLNKSILVGSDIRNKQISVFANYETIEDLEKLLKDAVVSSGFYFSSSGTNLRISSQPIDEKPELVTHVIQLQHLQSDFAFRAVSDVLNSKAEEGQFSGVHVSPSPTTNAIIVTAPEEVIETIRFVVSEIDKPQRQVVITAVVAELSDDDFDALGLNVGVDSKRWGLSGTTLGKADKSDLGLSLTFTGPTLSAFLNAVKSTGHNKILSTPQLLTLNRETASIVVGQNVPFVTGQTTSGSTPASDPFQTIVREDVGVTLEVTPFITPSNAIELSVKQSASSVSNDKTASDIITNTRRISTRVQLQDGDGVLLGGLRSETVEKSTSRVPGLSAIPVIGKIFTSRSERKRNTNLVVLLTARIYGTKDAFKFGDDINKLNLDELSLTGKGMGAARDFDKQAKAQE